MGSFKNELLAFAVEHFTEKDALVSALKSIIELLDSAEGCDESLATDEVYGAIVGAVLASDRKPGS